MLIQFQKERAPFPGVQLNSECPELARHAKIGLSIPDDLKWTKHVTEIIKKADKRIYFVVQLKRAKVPPKEIIILFTVHVLGPYLSIPAKCTILLYLYTLVMQ